MIGRRPPRTSLTSSGRGPAASDEATADTDPARDVDRAYSAYDEHPIDEADAWGDLATFREAAASS